LADRISSHPVVERFRHEPRLRQRAAALGGVAVFFGGVLVAVGLAWVVLVLAVIAGSALALIAWTRRRGEISQAVRPGAERIGRQLGTAVRNAARTGVRRVKALSARPAKQEVPRRHDAATEPVAATELYGWPYAGSEDPVSAPIRAKARVDDERRRALRLNAHGAQLRRAGSPGQAVDLHLQALSVFEAIADPRAQAMTLNSLALALRAAGEPEQAVERFEESLTILREHEGEPNAGKVIANLGFTLLEQGAGDRGRELLSEALAKLPPESPAAQQVEAELRRAS
jgi:tetratricopeptide (TPR) repeat protein